LREIKGYNSAPVQGVDIRDREKQSEAFGGISDLGPLVAKESHHNSCTKNWRSRLQIKCSAKPLAKAVQSSLEVTVIGRWRSNRC
jgi:hypothetical protein